MNEQDGVGDFCWFIGRVEDVYDPTMQGRVRVRAYNWHEINPAILPSNVLPWAIVMQPTTSAGLHGIGHSNVSLLIGSEVFGYFSDGKTAQIPVILGVLGMSVVQDFNNSPNATTSVPYFSNLLKPNVPQSMTSTSGNLSTAPKTIQSNTTPVDTYVIGTLSQNEAQNLKNALGISESSNNYKCINTKGFVGKYQFGAAALQTTGFANKSAVSNASLQSPTSWTSKLGVNSVNDWFTNEPAQEIAMDLLLQNNYRIIKKAGVVSLDTPSDVLGGYLAVAHLLGPGGAINMKGGQVGVDGYGTSSSKYFILGSTACKVS